MSVYENDPPSIIAREEARKTYRLLINLLFVRVRDFLAINPSENDIKYVVQPSTRWLYSNSERAFGFLWVCDTLGLSSTRVLQTFVDMKAQRKSGSKLGYEAFCNILYNIIVEEPDFEQ